MRPVHSLDNNDDDDNERGHHAGAKEPRPGSHAGSSGAQRMSEAERKRKDIGDHSEGRAFKRPRPNLSSSQTARPMPSIPSAHNAQARIPAGPSRNNGSASSMPHHAQRRPGASHSLGPFSQPMPNRRAQLLHENRRQTISSSQPSRTRPEPDAISEGMDRLAQYDPNKRSELRAKTQPFPLPPPRKSLPSKKLPVNKDGVIEIPSSDSEESVSDHSGPTDIEVLRERAFATIPAPAVDERAARQEQKEIDDLDKRLEGVRLVTRSAQPSRVKAPKVEQASPLRFKVPRNPRPADVEVIEIDDDDEEPVRARRPPPPRFKARQSLPAKLPSHHVIDLTLSSDDDEPVARPAARPAAGSQPKPAPKPHTSPISIDTGDERPSREGSQRNDAARPAPLAVAPAGPGLVPREIVASPTSMDNEDGGSADEFDTGGGDFNNDEGGFVSGSDNWAFPSPKPQPAGVAQNAQVLASTSAPASVVEREDSEEMDIDRNIPSPAPPRTASQRRRDNRVSWNGDSEEPEDDPRTLSMRDPFRAISYPPIATLSPSRSSSPGSGNQESVPPSSGGSAHQTPTPPPARSLFARRPFGRSPAPSSSRASQRSPLVPAVLASAPSTSASASVAATSPPPSSSKASARRSSLSSATPPPLASAQFASALPPIAGLSATEQASSENSASRPSALPASESAAKTATTPARRPRKSALDSSDSEDLGYCDVPPPTPPRSLAIRPAPIAPQSTSNLASSSSSVLSDNQLATQTGIVPSKPPSTPQKQDGTSKPVTAAVATTPKITTGTTANTSDATPKAPARTGRSLPFTLSIAPTTSLNAPSQPSSTAATSKAAPSPFAPPVNAEQAAAAHHNARIAQEVHVSLELLESVAEQVQTDSTVPNELHALAAVPESWQAPEPQAVSPPLDEEDDAAAILLVQTLIADHIDGTRRLSLSPDSSDLLAAGGDGSGTMEVDSEDELLLTGEVPSPGQALAAGLESIELDWGQRTRSASRSTDDMRVDDGPSVPRGRAAKKSRGSTNQLPPTPPESSRAESLERPSMATPAIRELVKDHANKVNLLQAARQIRWPGERLPTLIYDTIANLLPRSQTDPHLRSVFCNIISDRAVDDEPDAPPVTVANTIDDEPCPPFEFAYSNRLVYGNNVRRGNPERLVRCGCVGGCKPDSKTCECVKHQRLYWKLLGYERTGFNVDENGHVIEPEFPIFECNDECGCDEACMNRVVQRGRKFSVEVKKTLRKGWGVFAKEDVPARSFVGIYAGELITLNESDSRGDIYDIFGRTYQFSADFWYLKQGYRTKLRKLRAKEPLGNFEPEDDQDQFKMFCVDAFHVGNFTRFLNHSCEPNCVVVAVYINEPHVFKPFLCMFTKEVIKAGEELTFRYGGGGSDDNADGKKKKPINRRTKKNATLKEMVCHCGAKSCSGRYF